MNQSSNDSYREERFEAEQCFVKGRLHARADKLEESEAWFRKAIEIDPLHVSAYNWLIYVLEAQERWEEADELYRKVKSISKSILAESEKPDDRANADYASDHVHAGINSEATELNLLLAELDSLIGLKSVKYEISQLINLADIQKLRRDKGLLSNPISLHCAFVGNPGTGKTTVARLYGEFLKNIGLLSSGHLVETDRADLVGAYIGWTESKTDRKIEEALGGVLFIDEAYSLFLGDKASNDFGHEAVQVLLKRMEDYRDNIAVIVAGYPQPMKVFLKSHEGLQSRFTNTVIFDDYSLEELVDIFQHICKKNNYIPTSDSIDLFRKQIQYDYDNRDETFGNARYVRNCFELIVKNQARRLSKKKKAEITCHDLVTLLPEDFSFYIEM